MKKKAFILLLGIMTLGTTVIARDCFFSFEQELTCYRGDGSSYTRITGYSYSGTGSNCSNQALQKAYLEAALVMMDAASGCD